MGKTIPSYRLALEDEISKWKNFRDGLASEEDRQALDQLIDFCRTLSSASTCATNPIIFEPMVMSIMLAQQKKLRSLENKLNDVHCQKIYSEEQQN